VPHLAKKYLDRLGYCELLEGPKPLKYLSQEKKGKEFEKNIFLKMFFFLQNYSVILTL
jgi:hypothetical protein